jgi:hypothetical protein
MVYGGSRIGGCIDWQECRLGWFQNQQNDKADFTIGALGDENMPSLGGKEEVSKMEDREIGHFRIPVSGIVRWKEGVH